MSPQSPHQPPAMTERARLVGALVALLDATPGELHVVVKGNGLDLSMRLPAGVPAAPSLDPRERQPLRLSEMEANAIEAIGTATMSGQEVAEAAGYPFDSRLKACLESLRRRGILGGGIGERGYYLIGSALGCDRGGTETTENMR